MESNELSLLMEFHNQITKLLAAEREVATAAAKSEKIQSDSVDLIAQALSAAQGLYEPLEFEKVNVYTKTEYNDLEAIIKATRNALSKNNLAFTQIINQGLGETLILTELIHSSGQWIMAKSRVLPIKDDHKATESAIQFAKRQAAMSLLGIAGRNDFADDDAVAASAGYRLEKDKGLSINRDYKPDKVITLSKDHIAELDYELQGKDNQDILKDIFDTLRVESIADIPESMYRDVITKVRSIKALRAGIIKR